MIKSLKLASLRREQLSDGRNKVSTFHYLFLFTPHVTYPYHIIGRVLDDVIYEVTAIYTAVEENLVRR